MHGEYILKAAGDTAPIHPMSRHCDIALYCIVSWKQIKYCTKMIVAKEASVINNVAVTFQNYFVQLFILTDIKN